MSKRTKTKDLGIAVITLLSFLQLADNLAPGSHTVAVVKRTETSFGVATFAGYSLLPPPPPVGFNAALVSLNALADVSCEMTHPISK
jgi:hypothetical protein